MLDRDSPAASRNHAATTILELGFGRNPTADKVDVQPATEAATEDVQDPRGFLVRALENVTQQQLVECPACGWWTPEESVACTHCGLLAENVTDQMLKDAQDAKANNGPGNTPRRKIDARSFATMLANLEKKAGTEAAEESEVRSERAIATRTNESDGI
jgi:hypothetical protein